MDDPAAEDTVVCVGSKEPDSHNCWRTPQHPFAVARTLVHGYGGRIIIDLAASIENALLPCFYNKRENALSHNWACDAAHKQPPLPEGVKPYGFGNPPYDDIDRWLRQAYREALRGFGSVWLIPAYDGTRRWSRLIVGKAVLVYNLAGRLRFGDPLTGKPGDQAKFASCLVVYAPLDEKDDGAKLETYTVYEHCDKL